MKNLYRFAHLLFFILLFIGCKEYENEEGGQTLLLLGDSITVGWTGTYCGYRGYLKDNLNKYNFNCCFLGTKDDNSDMLEDKYKHYYAIVGYRIEN